MLDKLKMVKDKVKVHKYGLMGHIIRVNGKMIWLMVKASFIKLMEDIIKVISRKINSMVMVNMYQQIRKSFIKVNSFNICNMVMVQRFL